MKITPEMKKQLLIVISCLLSFSLSAQQDPEAMKVLSDFSKKAKSAPSVSIDFSLVTNDSRDGSITEIEGSAIISGDKYKLILPDNSVWADGKTIWSYLPEVNEVTITEADPDDESFISKPSLLFSLYNEGYKIRLIEQTVKEWVIDLYPEDISGNLMRIRLKIGKSSHDLKSAEYKTKDGINITLYPQKYDLTFKPTGDYFTFNPASYKGIEVVDMR